MIVTEEEVHSALEYLRNSAHALGEATKREKRAEHMVKVQEGFGYQMAEGAAESRKSQARTAAKYIEAVEEHATAYGESRKLYALREAASAVIESWRTQQATLRHATKL